MITAVTICMIIAVTSGMIIAMTCSMLIAMTSSAMAAAAFFFSTHRKLSTDGIPILALPFHDSIHRIRFRHFNQLELGPLGKTTEETTNCRGGLGGTQQL